MVASTDVPELSPTYIWPDLMPPPTSSSASRPLPHIQQLISNIQRLSGMRNEREQPVMDEPLALGSEPPNLCQKECGFESGCHTLHTAMVGAVCKHTQGALHTRTEFGEDRFQNNEVAQQPLSNNLQCSDMKVAQQPLSNNSERSADNMELEWILSEWSPCSVTCGNNGFQIRSVHCMLMLHNNSKNVDANACLDAGLVQPVIKQKCGEVACPHWVPSDWQPCIEARCFTYNTAMQRRSMECHSDNGTVLEDTFCDDLTKPILRQECYNDKCKGTWRVGDWSECAASCEAQGVKYRILQCVWYGTKKPAGNACRDIPRPSVMKTCKGPTCSDKTECLDHSKYCQNIRAMNMCRMYRYQTQCCQSCSNSKH